MAIQEKEKMYIELREILARQPGPEVTEQLSEFQRALRNKTKQLKRIAAELNMSEAAQQEQDMEIHRLAQELQVIRQKSKLTDTCSATRWHFSRIFTDIFRRWSKNTFLQKNAKSPVERKNFK